MERVLISSILNGTVYGKIRHLLREDMVSQDAWRLILCLDDLIPATGSVKPLELFEHFSLVRYPGVSKNVKESVLGALQGIQDSPPPVSTGEQLVKALLEREHFTKIRDLSQSLAEGDGEHSVEEVENALDQYRTELGRTNILESSLIDLDIPELFASTAVDGFEFRMSSLKTAIGPLPKGSMVLAAARPEAGKSTFLASEVSHMALELPEDRTVLVIANEEPGAAIKTRYVQAALGMSRVDIQKDPIKAKALFESTHKRTVTDLYKFFHNPSFRMYDIRKLAEKYKPSIIVFDQLRNVQGFEKRSGTEVERLKFLYQEARQLAAEYGVVLTVHQAGGASEGVDYIPGNNLEGCQTEVQGSLDVQIMIGRKNDIMEPEHKRYLNIVKNKLPGCRDESLRHGKFEVEIDPVISRFK